MAVRFTPHRTWPCGSLRIVLDRGFTPPLHSPLASRFPVISRCGLRALLAHSCGLTTAARLRLYCGFYCGVMPPARMALTCLSWHFSDVQLHAARTLVSRVCPRQGRGSTPPHSRAMSTAVSAAVSCRPLARCSPALGCLLRCQGGSVAVSHRWHAASRACSCLSRRFSRVLWFSRRFSRVPLKISFLEVP